MTIGALIARINEQLHDSADQHRHPDLVKRAVGGPRWLHRDATGYRHLVYEVIREQDGQVRHIRAVYIPTIRRLAAELWRELKAHSPLGFDAILELCHGLLERKTVEYRVIAFDWCFRMKRYYAPAHFRIFARWVKTHLTDWGSVDDFCTHTMGFFVHKYPEFAADVKPWALSKNPWIRRAAAVTFIYGLRRGTFLDHAFEVADTLLTDAHKYVQWGYGWMLKEGSKHFVTEVFDYVMSHKHVMSRRSLRYAIEKMPNHLKEKALQ